MAEAASANESELTFEVVRPDIEACYFWEIDCGSPHAINRNAFPMMVSKVWLSDADPVIEAVDAI